MSEDHDHEGSADHMGHVLSVGIDIGSSTTHLMFSLLTIGRMSPVPGARVGVLAREIRYRSPILLTPFSDGNLEVEKLQEFFGRAYEEAGVKPEAVDTGAVIVTGEAARRRNARAVNSMFSEQAGRFVCATAGHHLEARLAAHGSGAVRVARDRLGTVLNLDIGGGTTKVALVVRGQVRATAAINLGARLVNLDAAGNVDRLHPAAEIVAARSGVSLSLGSPVSPLERKALAEEMSRLIYALISGAKGEIEQLWLTEPFLVPDEVEAAVLSGGVSEYAYGRETGEYGDLGAEFGASAYAGFKDTWPHIPLVEPDEGIRATVVGASQFSLKLSGDTVFVPEDAALPMHGLAVLKVFLETSPNAESVATAIQKTLLGSDPQVRRQGTALAFVGPPFRGYSIVAPIVEGIAAGLKSVPESEQPRVIAFDQNLAQVVGQRLSKLAPDRGLICIDEVEFEDLDYLDVGPFPPGESYLPLVIKSLVF